MFINLIKPRNQLYLYKNEYIIMLIVFLTISGINTIIPYKILYFENIDIIVSISDNKMLFHQSSTLSQVGSYEFVNEQKINSSEESSMVDGCYFYYNEVKPLIIVIKDNIFFYTDRYFIGAKKVENITNINSNIISIECSIENLMLCCYFFIAVIDEDVNLKIYKYKYIKNSNELSCINYKMFELKKSTRNNSKSKCKNVSCQIMTYSSKNVLTCFYENDNSELGAININIETLEQDSSKEIKLIKNSGTKYLRSVLFDDNQKALICYINDYKNMACVIYEINGNQFLLEYKYIEECSEDINYFSLDYFPNKNQYILSCFNSNFSNVEYAILDYQLDISDNSRGNYCLMTMDFQKCSSGPFSWAIISDSIADVYFLKKICANGDIEIETKYELEETCNKDYNKEIIDIKQNEEIPTDFFPPAGPFKELDNEEIITNKTLEVVVNNLNRLIKEVNISKIYDIKSDEYEMRISPLDIRYIKDNSTYINFLECEKKLRRKNRDSPPNNLYVIILEIYKNDESCLTNQVEYAIFNEKKEQINLEECHNDDIQINYKISNNSSLDKDKLLYFSNLGIDILNSKDEFFNNICLPYSEKSIDVILNDRIANIYQNYSLCDNNCQYEKIDLTSMIISCKCKIKTSINSKIEQLSFDNILLDIFSNSSIGVVKCYELVFNFKNKLNNMGFWIFSIMFLFHIGFIIYFFVQGMIPMKKFIAIEMRKYNYLENFNNPNKKVKFDLYNISNNQITSEVKNIQRRKRKFKTVQIYSRIKEDSKIRNHNNNILVFKNMPKKERNKEIDYSSSKNNLGGHEKSISLTISGGEIIHRNKLKYDNKTIKRENDYVLIQINAHNSPYNEPPDSNFYLTNYDYEEAIKYDKRSFWRIYYICLLTKENILNILLIKSPLELFPLRLSVFLFTYSCDLAFNTLFYFNSNISDRYHYEGHSLFWFSLFNNIMISIISMVSSFSLCVFLQYLTNSKENVEDIFREEEKKMRKSSSYFVSRIQKRNILMEIYEINKKLKIKIILFIILEFLLLLFFYYFVTAFCEVYPNTQVSWLCDSFVSFLIGFPIEFFLAFFIAVLYKLSIKKKFKLLYKFAIGLYSLS